MTDEKRTTMLKIGAAVCVGLLILNYVVIGPIMSSWSGQSDRLDALRQKTARGQQLIDREDSIRNKWRSMLGANLPPEISAAESQAIQAMDKWASLSGITFVTRTPQWQDHDEGYQTYEVRATANGTQAALSRFLYEMETDTTPVNLEEYEIVTRNDHGTDLSLSVRFSFLRLKTATAKGGRS